MVFNRDYVNFKNYFTQGYAIMINALVQERPFGNRDEYELKIRRILMLSDVKEEMIKSISLQVPLDKVSEDFIDKISEYTTSKNGHAMLKFMVYDKDEKINVDMFSRNQKINITDNLIKFLLNEQDIEFKLN